VREPGRSAAGLLAPLLTGSGVGLLLTWLHLPAGALVGAVVGSALATGRRAARDRPNRRRLDTAVRVAGMVLLGCVSAARLDQDTLRSMLRICVPVVAGVVVLLALNVVLARWLVRRRGIDSTTAVLACAPGGFSELSVMAVREGADVGTVAVVHLCRVLIVVLVLVPALVLVLSGG
jgi:uncharacterized protein